MTTGIERDQDGKLQATTDAPQQAIGRHCCAAGVYAECAQFSSILSVLLPMIATRAVRYAAHGKSARYQETSVTSSSGMVIERRPPWENSTIVMALPLSAGCLQQYQSGRAGTDRYHQACGLARQDRSRSLYCRLSAGGGRSSAGPQLLRQLVPSRRFSGAFRRLYSRYDQPVSPQGRHFTCWWAWYGAAGIFNHTERQASEELARKSASILIPYELAAVLNPLWSFNGVRSPMIRKAIRIFEETLEDRRR